MLGKQEIVMRVPMENAKKRIKALKTAVGLPGVLSAALADKDLIVVVGEEVDSVELTVMLRKKMRIAELVSVKTLEEKKKVEKKTEIDPPVFWSYPYQRQPYMAEISDNGDYEPSCRIM